MPRVLWLFEYPTLNGGEESLLAAIPLLQGHDFHGIALAPDEGLLADALHRHHIDVIPWTPAPSEDKKPALLAYRNRLDSIIAQLKPDLLHANSLAMSRLSGPVAAERRVPSVGHLRDIISLSRQAILDMNRHTRLLAVSQATADWHVRQGLSADRVYVCLNGVDLNRFRPRAATGYLHRELKLPSTARLVGSVGQMIPRKGLDLTMQAMHELMARDVNLHWLIIGERYSQKAESLEFESKLRQCATQAPLAGHVHFLGGRRDMDRVFNELSLLIHAARQEPLGRVLLEAASSGTPIVATDVGGTTEILPREIFADLLVPPNAPDALVCAASRLLGDSQLHAQCAIALRDRAVNTFAIEDSAARLAQHFWSVLDAR